MSSPFSEMVTLPNRMRSPAGENPMTRRMFVSSAEIPGIVSSPPSNRRVEDPVATTHRAARPSARDAWRTRPGFRRARRPLAVRGPRARIRMASSPWAPLLSEIRGSYLGSPWYPSAASIGPSPRAAHRWDYLFRSPGPQGGRGGVLEAPCLRCGEQRHGDRPPACFGANAAQTDAPTRGGSRPRRIASVSATTVVSQASRPHAPSLTHTP